MGAYDGPVTDAVRAKLDSLTEPDGALAALAVSLAQSLDEGAGMAAAAVARELRATLSELTAVEVKRDDDDDAFAAWEAQLGVPAPIQHPED